MATMGLFIVGIIIIAGLLSKLLFKKTGIPDVLFLILLGVTLKIFNLTNTFNQSSPELNFMITFSLIYVIFYGALPIKLKAIFSTMKYAFLSSITNFLLITTLIGIIVKIFIPSFDLLTSFALASLFCVLDGSIINGLLEKIKLSEKAEAQIQTESAIIDTIVIVGILSLINFSSMSVGEITQSIAQYLFLSLGIGLVFAIVWAYTLKKIGNYSSAPIATMAILVLLYALGESTGANGAITVFSFSIILGNVQTWKKLLYKDEKNNVSVLDVSTKSFFKDISFLIRTLFFVYLGILVNLDYWIYLIIGALFFIVAYILRSFINYYFNNKSLKAKEIYFLDAMSAKGLTPIILLLTLQTNIVFSSIVIGGIFSSVLITSILIYLIDKNKFTAIPNMLFNKK